MIKTDSNEKWRTKIHARANFSLRTLYGIYSTTQINLTKNVFRMSSKHQVHKLVIFAVLRTLVSFTHYFPHANNFIKVFSS